MKNIKVKNTTIEVPEGSPRYFFIKYSSGGKTYYVNEKGKRVPKKKVLSGRRKTYEAILSGPAKGKTIDKKKKPLKAKKFKKEKDEGKYMPFVLLNVNIYNEFTYYLERGFSVAVTNTGGEENFILKSQNAKSEFILFVAELNKQFFASFKKITEYPFFNIELLENKKVKKALFDFSKISFKVKNEKKLKAVIDAFIIFKNALFNKYFK